MSYFEMSICNTVPEEKSPKKAAKKKKKNIEEIYKKLDHIEHALQRPDMYIGSAKIQEQKLWVYDKPQVLPCHHVDQRICVFSFFVNSFLLLIRTGHGVQKDSLCSWSLQNL